MGIRMKVGWVLTRQKETEYYLNTYYKTNKSKLFWILFIKLSRCGLYSLRTFESGVLLKYRFYFEVCYPNTVFIL